MRHAVIALAAFALAATPAFAQDPARMDKVASADAESGQFMGAVLVAKDGRILFDKGYGSANLEWKIPNDGDTKFRLGSITKQFTAVSILLLQERGKLSINAPVKTYLPDAPAAWDGITLHHLLTHTSGIPNFTDLPDFAKLNTLPATPDSLIARFRDLPLEFKPGEKNKYSNSGYILLGAIIEKLSGQSYADFVGQNIFKPLGMADSGYDTHAAILPRRASGYSPTPKGPQNADYADMTIPHGAGALYSTTHDLLKWQTGLFGGKLLKPESMKAFLTPALNNYALGVSVRTDNGATTVAHSGGIQGFNTWMGHDPDAKLTVVVLANLNGPAASRLGGSLMTLARGGSVTLNSERKALTLAADKQAEFVGIYEMTPTVSFTIKPGDGRLIAQLTGQGPLDLYAEGGDRFFFKVVDAQIAFTRDAAGKIDGATMVQNGRTTRAKRK